MTSRSTCHLTIEFLRDHFGLTDNARIVDAWRVDDGIRFVTVSQTNEDDSVRDKAKSNYVPWRHVASVETPESGDDFILHLECGHTETWPRFSSTPVATICTTCDPPTFHGKPFTGENVAGDT